MREFPLKLAAMMLTLIILFGILPLQYNASVAEPSGTLPVIYINTENGKDVEHRSFYINAEMKINLDNDNEQFTNLYTEDFKSIKIRGRGNSTWGMPKKPYHIKLGEKASLFGMSKSRDWILLANALDGTNLRNTLSYNLSGEFGLYSIKNIHVELVFNGKYAGLYQLTESIKIAPDRINITDWEKIAEKVAEAIAKKEGFIIEDTEQLVQSMKNDLGWITAGTYDKYKIEDYYDITTYDTTGGYLIELDEYYDEISKFVSDHDVPIMIKQPEYLNTNKEMFDYINKYINDMENALFSDDGYNEYNKHYSEYVDMESFIDYWIVNQVFKSVELLYKSAFMYKDSDGPLIIGPVWDMDWSSGNHVNLVASSATYNEWKHSESQDREYWYRAIYDDPYFIVSLQDRWFQVHDIITKYIDSVDEWQDKLNAAAEINNSVWGEMGGWDFNKECKVFKTWMNNRREWMDEQLNLRDPDIMQMGINQSENIKLLFVGTDGYDLNNGSADGILNTDAYYNGSGTIYVNTAVSAVDIKTFDVYINSLKTGTYNVTSNKVTFEINTTGMHTTDSGRRNVILIIGRDSDNNINGKAYRIISVSGKIMRTVKYLAGAESESLSARTVSYAEGTNFNLPVNTFTREGYTFIGWTDNINTYSAGDKYTVQTGRGDILFTALWQQNDAKSGENIFFTAAIIIPITVVVITICTGLYFVLRKKRSENTK